MIRLAADAMCRTNPKRPERGVMILLPQLPPMTPIGQAAYSASKGAWWHDTAYRPRPGTQRHP